MTEAGAMKATRLLSRPRVPEPHLRVPRAICGYLGTPFKSTTPREFCFLPAFDLDLVPASTRIPATLYI
jgi:hypothetical protein